MPGPGKKADEPDDVSERVLKTCRPVTEDVVNEPKSRLYAALASSVRTRVPPENT